MNELADPAYLLPVVRDFPTLDVVLAHGGRGWWYDAAALHGAVEPDRVDRAVRAAAQAAAGVLPRATTSAGWPAGGSSRTDWPGVPAPRRTPAPWSVSAWTTSVAADVLGGNALRGLRRPRQPRKEHRDERHRDRGPAGRASSPTRSWRPRASSCTTPATGCSCTAAPPSSRRTPGGCSSSSRSTSAASPSAPGRAGRRRCHAEPTPADDPVVALLRARRRRARRPDAQARGAPARRGSSGSTGPTLARLYTAEPKLLATDKQDRVITDAGRDRLAAMSSVVVTARCRRTCPSRTSASRSSPGPARGIGAATAERLAAEGCAVAVLDLDEARRKDTVEPIAAQGGRGARGRRRRQRRGRRSRPPWRRGRRPSSGAPTVLVNNAGVLRDNLLFKMSAGDWDTVMSVHLRGAFLMTRAARGTWSTATSAGSSTCPPPPRWATAARPTTPPPRPACRASPRPLAIELGKFGVTANAVAPGFIVTEMTAATADARRAWASRSSRPPPPRQIPVSRVGEPEDVANAIAFFAGEGAGFVSGQVLYVAGGPRN